MSKKIVEISYLLSKKTFMPGTIAPPSVRVRTTQIKQPEGLGESEIRWEYHNRTSWIEMFSHSGTHIDCPLHIDPQGLAVDDFEIEEFIFDNPVLLELPKGDLEKITKDDLSAHEDEFKGSDLLLVYTGFSKYREGDPDRYFSKSPGFSIEGAKYLIDNFSLRAVGVDLMGVENVPEARPEYPVHRIFLMNGKKRFIQMEDANLAPLSGKKLGRAYIIPLRVKDIEAMPVRAFAEVEE